jgi:hypothetical protein
VSRIQTWFVGAAIRVIGYGVPVCLWVSRRAWAWGWSSGRTCRRTGSKVAIVFARFMISLLVLWCSSGRRERRDGKLRRVARCGFVSAGQVYCCIAAWVLARCWMCQILLFGGIVVVVVCLKRVRLENEALECWIDSRELFMRSDHMHINEHGSMGLTVASFGACRKSCRDIEER